MHYLFHVLISSSGAVIHPEWNSVAGREDPGGRGERKREEGQGSSELISRQFGGRTGRIMCAEDTAVGSRWGGIVDEKEKLPRIRL